VADNVGVRRSSKLSVHENLIWESYLAQQDQLDPLDPEDAVDASKCALGCIAGCDSECFACLFVPPVRGSSGQVVDRLNLPLDENSEKEHRECFVPTIKRSYWDLVDMATKMEPDTGEETRGHKKAEGSKIINGNARTRIPSRSKSQLQDDSIMGVSLVHEKPNLGLRF
jgi:hypothetical protein